MASILSVYGRHDKSIRPNLIEIFIGIFTGWYGSSVDRQYNIGIIINNYNTSPPSIWLS